MGGRKKKEKQNTGKIKTSKQIEKFCYDQQKISRKLFFKSEACSHTTVPHFFVFLGDPIY